MKQILTVLTSFVMLWAVHHAYGLDNASYREDVALTTEEANALAFAWEVEKYLRDIYLTGNTCSNNPSVASAATVQQEHMDLLKQLLGYYGLDVPVLDEKVGAFSDTFLSTIYNTGQFVWTGYSYACFNPDFSIYFNAMVYEEFAIWNLLRSIEQTENHRLFDAYNYLLDDACTHLRLFASLHPLGWEEPLFVSQNMLDEIMGGTFPTAEVSEFVINSSLNDAWYYPGTDGQGFFISVFPSLGTMSLAWFTFDTVFPDANAVANLGDPGQRWLIASGKYEGSQATLNVRSVSGGLFDTSPPEPEREIIGSVILQFESCNSGTLTYDLPSVSRTGVIPIERVALDNVSACEAYQ